ncbi:NADP-dependent oxidoreductase domain-containing protein [Scenedesmus sp. NREL 46B-D3]|nr:NADP-dependent oxidoreductase domain-containing protein [Scenedesmus sp. NREL 46B-D3]
MIIAPYPPVSLLCMSNQSCCCQYSSSCSQEPAGNRSNDGFATQIVRNTGLEVSCWASGHHLLVVCSRRSMKLRALPQCMRHSSWASTFRHITILWLNKERDGLGQSFEGLATRQDHCVHKSWALWQEFFDFSAERMAASVRESLARLQIPYIDIIQCHDIEFGSLDQVINETLPALQQLKAQGLVRCVGVTGLPLKALQYVLDRVPPGTVDVILSYCHYSLNDTSLADAIPYFQEKQVGIISASPLSMGLLTPQGPPEWHPAPPELKEAAAAAAACCRDQGVDLTKLALQFAVKNPSISTTLVGMCSSGVVRANVTAVLQALGAEAADSSSVRQERKALEEVERIMAPVKGLTWASGRPENQ